MLFRSFRKNTRVPVRTQQTAIPHLSHAINLLKLPPVHKPRVTLVFFFQQDIPSRKQQDHTHVHPNLVTTKTTYYPPSNVRIKKKKTIRNTTTWTQRKQKQAHVHTVNTDHHQQHIDKDTRQRGRTLEYLTESSKRPYHGPAPTAYRQGHAPPKKNTRVPDREQQATIPHDQTKDNRAQATGT